MGEPSSGRRSVTLYLTSYVIFCT